MIRINTILCPFRCQIPGVFACFDFVSINISVYGLVLLLQFKETLLYLSFELL
eukprot:XP_001708163.1 Hypothetical protein GL50803_32220 [Giardia lamblia ATCC 50803]